jgi:hypothetical protein
MNTYIVMFVGQTFTRNSEHTYTHAAFNPNRKGNRSWVTFHGSENAAKKAAGRYGLVSPVVESITDMCTVCEGMGNYEVGPAASDGRMIIVKCHNCGGTGRK